MRILHPNEGESRMALASFVAGGASGAAAAGYDPSTVAEAVASTSSSPESVITVSTGSGTGGSEDLSNPGFGGTAESPSSVPAIIKDNAGAIVTAVLTAISFLPFGGLFKLIFKIGPFLTSLLGRLLKLFPSKLISLPFSRPATKAIAMIGELLYTANPVYAGKSDSMKRPWFAPGSKGTAIGNVTTKLAALGAGVVKSNTYDAANAVRVLAWQKANKVPATEHQNKGIWGAVSWARLDIVFTEWQKKQPASKTTTTTPTTTSTKAAVIAEFKQGFAAAGGIFARAVGWVAANIGTDTSKTLNQASVTNLPFAFFKALAPVMAKMLAGYAKAATNDSPQFMEGAYWSQFRMPGTTATLAQQAGLKGGLPMNDIAMKSKHLMLYCLYIDDIAKQLFDTQCMPKDQEVRKAYVEIGLDKADTRVRMVVTFFLLWHCRNLKKLWRDQRFTQAAVAAACAVANDIVYDKNS